MKYFESAELFCALVATVLYGMICGGFYGIIYDVLSALCSALLLPFKAIVANDFKSEIKSNIFRQKIEITNLYDFLSSLAFGIGYIFLTYAFTDGGVRIYLLCIFLLSVYISHRSMGGAFSCFFRRVFLFFYVPAFAILYYVLRPLNFLFHFFKRKLLSAMLYIRNKVLLAKSERLMNRKLLSIGDFFK